MNKADGFIVLHMGAMQRMTRWKKFDELLFTFAAHVLGPEPLSKQFGFQRSLYCTNGASHAFVSGRTSDVGIAMLSADRLQMALSLWIHTCALPCRVVKVSHVFLLTFVGNSLARRYMYIATLDKKSCQSCVMLSDVSFGKWKHLGRSVNKHRLSMNGTRQESNWRCTRNVQPRPAR